MSLRQERPIPREIWGGQGEDCGVQGMRGRSSGVCGKSVGSYFFVSCGLVGAYFY